MTPPTLVDTHCHLDAHQFAPEGAAPLLARAAAAGVSRVVTIGTNLASSERAAALARAGSGPAPAVGAAVGVDPNEAAGFDRESLATVAALAGRGGVVAIGEIGLDYYWDAVPRDAQRAVFEEQLTLAREVALPVVIHSRDAADDTARVLETWAADHPWRGMRPLGVMHCFSGDLELALRLIHAGFLVSAAGNVTYKSAATLQRVAAEVPDDALVLETDAPYLAPLPHRGARNEPSYVAETAAFVAALRGVTPDAVAEATSANAARLFGWEAA